MIKSWYRRPLIHFLVLGCLLYAVEQWRLQYAAYQISAPDAAFLTNAGAQVETLQGRPLTPVQQAALRQHEIDQRILFSEALRRELHLTDPIVKQRLLRNAAFLGMDGSAEQQMNTALSLELHRGDEVIRRRLIQRMEALGSASGALTAPTEAQLRAAYEADIARWSGEPSYSFRHIFISADKRDMQQRAEDLLQQLRSGGGSGAAALSQGDSFLLGSEMSQVSAYHLERSFGESFSQWMQQHSAAQLQSSLWQGPVASAYGLHLVKITGFHPATERAFASVKSQLREELLQQQRANNLQGFLQQLRQRYRVRSP